MVVADEQRQRPAISVLRLRAQKQTAPGTFGTRGKQKNQLMSTTARKRLMVLILQQVLAGRTAEHQTIADPQAAAALLAVEVALVDQVVSEFVRPKFWGFAKAT